jgi:hypothetical protein
MTGGEHRSQDSRSTQPHLEKLLMLCNRMTIGLGNPTLADVEWTTYY